MRDEPARAEQSLLLAGPHREQDRALQFRARGLQLLGEIDQGCDVGRIVEGAVVDAVAVPGLADAVAVQVRGDHDVFARRARDRSPEARRACCRCATRRSRISYGRAGGGECRTAAAACRRQQDPRVRGSCGRCRRSSRSAAAGFSGTRRRRRGTGAGAAPARRHRHRIRDGPSRRFRPAGGSIVSVAIAPGWRRPRRRLPPPVFSRTMIFATHIARRPAFEHERRVDRFRQSGTGGHCDLSQPLQLLHGSAGADESNFAFIRAQPDRAHRNGLIPAVVHTRGTQPRGLELFRPHSSAAVR